MLHHVQFISKFNEVCIWQCDKETA